ncbi:RNA 2',3'-cyclic phosphodiesterase [Xenophilus sp. AP218F]|nr:RNA 2',3'-cyclic phosphodiesterase [Xenophilus sp. AP218F]
MNTQRCFLACLPPAHCLPGLLRQQEWLAAQVGGRIIPAAQLHLTLAFLGELDDTALQEAVACAGQSAAGLYGELTLDRAGSFDAGAVWSGSSAPPERLLAWQARLRDALGARGIALPARPFVPHISLLRRPEREVAPQALPPLSLPLQELCLLASAPQASGARYQLLQRWAAW